MPNFESDDYYEVLGISKTSTSSQIKKAYHKLSLKYHPDKNKTEGAEEIFKKINEAYSVLSDEEKRKNYDRFGKNTEGGVPDINPNDIFAQFFNSNPGMQHEFGGGGINIMQHFMNMAQAQGGGHPFVHVSQSSNPFVRQFGRNRMSDFFFSDGDNEPFYKKPKISKPSLMKEGTTVLVKDLLSAKQYNGKLGIVEGFNESKQRYTINIKGERKSLRRSNLQQIASCKIIKDLLNLKKDTTGKITNYDDINAKYTIQFGNRQVSLSPDKIILDIDTNVKIIGLRGNGHGELNGQYGKIKGFDSAVSKYIVDLDNNKRIRLGMSNVVA